MDKLEDETTIESVFDQLRLSSAQERARFLPVEPEPRVKFEVVISNSSNPDFMGNAKLG